MLEDEGKLFLPRDKRLPKVRLPSLSAEAPYRSQLIIVAIDRWDVTSRYPVGHYVRTLGEVGNIEAETEAVLEQHDVRSFPFPPKVLECLPPADWTAGADPNVSQRTDLRHLKVFSVDPPGCTDIDDALHVRQLSDDRWEFGVHIADVTYFVREGTPLDEEALARSTSVYLADRRIDMLPSRLGESRELSLLLITDLCSLMSNVDRFAFSVLWEIDNDGKILDTKFTKSVVQSIASLSYEEAQLKIDDK